MENSEDSRIGYEMDFPESWFLVQNILGGVTLLALFFDLSNLSGQPKERQLFQKWADVNFAFTAPVKPENSPVLIIIWADEFCFLDGMEQHVFFLRDQSKNCRKWIWVWQFCYFTVWRVGFFFLFNSTNSFLVTRSIPSLDIEYIKNGGNHNLAIFYLEGLIFNSGFDGGEILAGEMFSWIAFTLV